MNSFLLHLKIPKHAGKVIESIKSEILKICIADNEDCVVDWVTGRLVLFSSDEICEKVKKIKGVIECHRVEIFEREEELIKKASEIVRNCTSFAVRSNHLHVAQRIGGEIQEMTNVAVNLDAPECEIFVEYRSDYYFLRID